MGEVKLLYPVAKGVLSKKPVPMIDLPPVVLASDYATLEADNAKLRAELERRVVDAITMEDVQRAYDYATDHPHKYLRGTTNWCAAVAYSLNQQRVAAPSAPKAGSGIYADDPLACSGCASGCFRCRTSAPKADAVRASLSVDNQRITPPDPIIAKPHPLSEISKADDPVKQMLLEALEAAEKKLCIAEYHLDKGEDDSVVFESEILLARAAIAAARQEGGKV